MNRKEQFERDKISIRGELTHIAPPSKDPFVNELDRLYGAADVLSIKNANKHRRILLELSAVGTLLTLLFLLYDEAELYGLIAACGLMILLLFLIRFLANRTQCHRKYLEYRVLAESLRVQYYLYMAGIKERVTELMTWSIKQEIPWITELISDLPEPRPKQKEPVIGYWIRDQSEYHQLKLKQMMKKHRRDSRIAKVTLIVTILAYAVAISFEFIVVQSHIGIDVNAVRAVLKVTVGTMSALTLFTGNYYGKMSLSNVIDDHERMIALYQSVGETINTQGESDELILSLARDCLNETGTWYAYQKKNQPDLVI